MGFVRVQLRHPYIDDDALAATHETLHHYTSLEALDQILASSGLWASHYRKLSDHSEFQLATTTVADRIYSSSIDAVRSAIRAQPGLEQRILKRYTTIDDLIREDSPTLPRVICKLADQYLPMHVTSFAAHVAPHEKTGGILSLWREYGGANGVAISFDVRKLLDVLSRIKASHSYHALFLAAVTYGDEHPLFGERIAGMPEIADCYLAVAKAMIDGQRARQFPDSIYEVSSKFMITSILHKHPAFADEREVRLVASPLVIDEQEEVPRAIPTWVDRTPSASRLLIECLDAVAGVMISPVRGQDDLAELTAELFRSYGRGTIPVVLSDIPTHVGG
jgi:hypothetical protein